MSLRRSARQASRSPVFAATLLPPADKETAIACVRIVEDGEVSRCRQNPFRGLAINA
jgi:hypothetical protein